MRNFGGPELRGMIVVQRRAYVGWRKVTCAEMGFKGVGFSKALGGGISMGRSVSVKG